ncbi:hypothetical protein ACFSC4_22865 [Deinococcus malanensis]|uniref:hypothetical protein n=1 Tax=Deinococcus malanensis TaxID=1706855 RepID=UPI00363A4959
MLLDGSTFRMNVVEFLTVMRQDVAWKELPVLVLSSSAAETDVQQCLLAGATDFITTPMGLDAYTEVVQRTLAFWADRTSSEES